jgi:protein-L-isoaspartate(D-aspartate) O-methyltransferase
VAHGGAVSIKMSWEYLLSNDDYGLYRRNISLLEEQVVNHFPNFNNAPDILSAIRKVPRHLFVNRSYRYMAYTDNAIPTSGGLTTSAPSVIAEMIYKTGIKRGEKLLEVGTGTGYEAAVLCEMGVRVFTIEIDKHLANRANQILVQLGYKIDKGIVDEYKRKQMMKRYNKIKMLFSRRGSIELYLGNGQFGMKQHPSFKGIIVAASVPQLRHIDHLFAQLSDKGGRLVVPAGKRNAQSLYIVEKRNGKFHNSVLEGVTFDFVRLFLDTP